VNSETPFPASKFSFSTSAVKTVIPQGYNSFAFYILIFDLPSPSSNVLLFITVSRQKVYPELVEGPLAVGDKVARRTRMRP
jgi:hypothetical protein